MSAEKTRIPFYLEKSAHFLELGAPCLKDAVFRAGTIPPHGPHLMIGSIDMCEATCRHEICWETGVFMRRRGAINPDGEIVEFVWPQEKYIKDAHPSRKVYLAFGLDYISWLDRQRLYAALERHRQRGGQVIDCSTLVREKKS